MNKYVILGAAFAVALLIFIRFRSDIPLLCDRQSLPQLQDTTFAIIKPEAVTQKHVGNIIGMIESHGFDILGMKKIRMTQKQAESFYAEHKDRPFFKDLVGMMTSGPVVVLALHKENAVKDWRDLMGPTDPKKAAAGTVRAAFGKDIQSNAVHGSDSQKSANIELKQFFPEFYR